VPLEVLVLALVLERVASIDRHLGEQLVLGAEVVTRVLEELGVDRRERRGVEVRLPRAPRGEDADVLDEPLIAARPRARGRCRIPDSSGSCSFALPWRAAPGERQ
jgi:hypothetical protein